MAEHIANRAVCSESKGLGVFSKSAKSLGFGYLSNYHILAIRHSNLCIHKLDLANNYDFPILLLKQNI